jgi:hypothetical protein
VGFVNSLDLRVYDAGEWVVLNDLTYRAKDNAVYTAAKGFVTDLASIPAPLRGILNVNGRSRMPAVLHDFLYVTQPISRERADSLFYEALVSVGVVPAVAWLYWAGVRIGGWLYYNQRTADSKADDFVPNSYFDTGELS